MNKDKRAMRPVWKLPNDKFKLLNKNCFLYKKKKKNPEKKNHQTDENHGLWKGEVNNNNIFQEHYRKKWSDLCRIFSFLCLDIKGNYVTHLEYIFAEVFQISKLIGGGMYI